MLGALLNAQHSPAPDHSSQCHPESWEAALGVAKRLVGLTTKPALGRERPQLPGQCPHQDHGWVRNRQPFEDHPPQHEDDARAALHPPHPPQCQQVLAAAPAAPRFTLSRVTAAAVSRGRPRPRRGERCRWRGRCLCAAGSCRRFGRTGS